jgi:hypothetical protein
VRQGVTGVEHLLQPMEELFESRKLMLATYLGGAIRVRNLLGAQAVLPWASRGADIMQSGRARGEAYFRLESEESLSVLLDHLPGYRMPERNRLLALLLEIWYERPVELKESTWSPDKGRPFVETDGRSVFIPAVMPDRDEAILAILHAAGRVVFGGFDRAALIRNIQRCGCRAAQVGQVAWAPLFARYGDDVPRFQLLFDACEDLRVDVRIQERVPNYLARLHAVGASHRLRPVESLPYYDLALDMVGAASALMHGQPSHASTHACGRCLIPRNHCGFISYCERTLCRDDARAGNGYRGLPGRLSAGTQSQRRTLRARADGTGSAAADAGGADGEKKQSDDGEQGDNDEQQNAETAARKPVSARRWWQATARARGRARCRSSARKVRSRADSRATRANRILNGITVKAATSATGAGCRRNRLLSRILLKRTG